MTLDDVIKQIGKSGSLVLNDQQITALKYADQSDVRVHKILGGHFFHSRQFRQGLEHTRKAHEIEGSAETEANLIAALQRAGQVQEALQVITDKQSQLEPRLRLTRTCELYANVKDWKNSHAYGLQALQAKDASVPAIDRSAPQVRPFDMNRPERNIIAFSLFGANPRYGEGAVRNAVLAKYMYPGWTPRFYVDDSVPADCQQKLQDTGAQLRNVPNLPAARYGLFWRFLVEDDPDVDFYIVRDADSVFNIRERVAVQTWLDSGQPFHVLRDFYTHCELMLAGMWGAQRGNLIGIGKAILDYVKDNSHVVGNRALDQKFLRDWVWPHVRGRACVQDRIFGFQETHPFDPRYDLPGMMHIGQNDAVDRQKAKAN